MSRYEVLATKIIEMKAPKTEDPFTVECLEEHHRQVAALQKTGHATVQDIHGTTITFTVEDHGEAHQKVLQVKDNMGHTVTEKMGPNDLFLSLYNSRLLMCQKYPDYGDNCSELRKIQRYCPFELGVWKDVPTGSEENVFKKAEKKHSKEKASKPKAELQRKQSPHPYREPRKSSADRWSDEKIKDLQKYKNEVVTIRSVSSVSSRRRRLSFLQRTRKFVRALFALS